MSLRVGDLFMKVSIESIAKTDVGRKRTLNEDAYLDQNQNALFVVADGMGGHAAGEIASKMAVEIIRDFIQKSQNNKVTWPFGWDANYPLEANRLNNSIKLANREIYDRANSDFSVAGMGTTIVAMIIRDGIAHVAHVGDSRAYLIRNSSIQRLTSDHSWVEDQIKVGNLTEDEAKQHPMRNVITRALGTHETVEVDLRMQNINIGDYFVLCSDGLTTHLDDSEILDALHKYDGILNDAADFLIDKTNLKGGDDNITVILVHLGQK